MIHSERRRYRSVPMLRPGDLIGVVSPAGPVSPAMLNAGLSRLEAEGFRIRPGRFLFAETGYLAGPDGARLDDLHAMFADAEVKAVFCSRGGYGSLRLLEHLDWGLLAANPKIFMGFSDITALLAPVSQRTGFVTFHGPVITQMGLLDHLDLVETLDVLRGAPFRAIRLPAQGRRRPGRAAGPLIGGNLTLFSHLLGTPYAPDLKGAVVFLEDHGEHPYRVDRMLRHLLLSGALGGISGLMGGQFTECGAEAAVNDLLLELAEALDVPFITGLQAGHGRRNILLPIGAEAVMDTEAGTLEIAGTPVHPGNLKQP